VSVLRGGSGETVSAWLSAHDYQLPTGGEPILANYIAHDWYFVAIRLASRAAGEIRPLAIAFHTGSIVYPMRLSHVATALVSLELFVDASHRATASGFGGLTVDYSGLVSALSPAPSKALRALLPGPTLTRIDASDVSPSSIHADIEIKLRS
jgi:Uncharacterized protein conserved in bacteria (DUF2330)